MLTPDQSEIVRARMVIYAKFLADVIQVREHGGQNRGEVVEKLLRKEHGNPGDPWCMAFCAALYESACAAFALKPDMDLNLSCSAGQRSAALLGRYHENVRLARAGDLVLLKGGPTGYKHVEIIISPANEAGVVATIGGNTNGAGSAEGDGVYRQKRSGNVGFITL